MIKVFKINSVENNQSLGAPYDVDLEFETLSKMENYRKEQEEKMSTKNRKIKLIFGFTEKK